MIKLVAPHEYQARELHPDIDDDGHFLRLEVVVEADQVHQRDVRAVDRRDERDASAHEPFDVFQGIDQAQAVLADDAEKISFVGPDRIDGVRGRLERADVLQLLEYAVLELRPLESEIAFKDVVIDRRLGQTVGERVVVYGILGEKPEQHRIVVISLGFREGLGRGGLTEAECISALSHGRNHRLGRFLLLELRDQRRRFQIPDSDTLLADGQVCKLDI